MVHSSSFLVVGLRQCHYFWSLLWGKYFREDYFWSLLSGTSFSESMVQSSFFLVVGLWQCHYLWSLLSGKFYREKDYFASKGTEFNIFGHWFEAAFVAGKKKWSLFLIVFFRAHYLERFVTGEKLVHSFLLLLLGTLSLTTKEMHA